MSPKQMPLDEHLLIDVAWCAKRELLEAHGDDNNMGALSTRIQGIPE